MPLDHKQIPGMHRVKQNRMTRRCKHVHKYGYDVISWSGLCSSYTMVFIRSSVSYIVALRQSWEPALYSTYLLVSLALFGLGCLAFLFSPIRHTQHEY